MKNWHLFSRKTKNVEEKWNVKTMFGANLGFAAAESYKVLRTNLKFSFPDDGQGKIIGFTSAVQSEGKSTTACNVAYALAEEQDKVLLIEADLRRPTVATKLSIARRPGLTNILVNREAMEDVVQRSSYAPNVDVICCGDVPPNPSELLGSEQMTQLLDDLRTKYRYIIVDLPPVTVVSDALAISKNLDGVVVVVREDVSDRKQLNEAMRQLHMAGVRILGFAYRSAEDSNKRYSYKKYKRYGYGYGYYSEYKSKN